MTTSKSGIIMSYPRGGKISNRGPRAISRRKLFADK
jgi:hypothetical protein